MELCSLHPFEESRARDFVAIVLGDGRSSGDSGAWPVGVIVEARRALELIETGSERGAFSFTYAFARGLAAQTPSYAHAGICLTTWEARVDRGVGMLLRPPARLFVDAGLDPAVARGLPIRLDLHRGTMGGAYVPARLMAEFERMLDTRLERSVRRLIEAEVDAVEVMALVIEVVGAARANGQALLEAMDVVTADGNAPGIPGARVMLADRKRIDKSMRTRLELAAKPPKKPGLWSRLTHRSEPALDDSVGGTELPR